MRAWEDSAGLIAAFSLRVSPDVCTSIALHQVVRRARVRHAGLITALFIAVPDDLAGIQLCKPISRALVLRAHRIAACISLEACNAVSILLPLVVDWAFVLEAGFVAASFVHLLIRINLDGVCILLDVVPRAAAVVFTNLVAAPPSVLHPNDLRGHLLVHVARWADDAHAGLIAAFID